MRIATNRVGLAVAVLGLVAGASGQAKAGLVLYQDLASFQAALGTPISTETFDTTTLIPGLSFTSTTGSAVISGGVFNDRLTPTTNTTFSFNPQITGFGANFDLSPGGAGLGVLISAILPGGGTEVLSPEVPNSATGQFFGFISTDPIASVQLTSGTQGGVAESYDLDNLTFGGISSSAVPEPSSIAMVASALPLGLGYWLRRRGRAAA